MSHPLPSDTLSQQHEKDSPEIISIFQKKSRLRGNLCSKGLETLPNHSPDSSSRRLIFLFPVSLKRNQSSERLPDSLKVRKGLKQGRGYSPRVSFSVTCLWILPAPVGPGFQAWVGCPALCGRPRLVGEASEDREASACTLMASPHCSQLASTVSQVSAFCRREDV